MPSETRWNGRSIPILALVLNLMIGAVLMPVGKCFYDEIREQRENIHAQSASQQSFGNQLAGYAHRLSRVEEQMNHLVDLRIKLERLHGDIKVISERTNINLSEASSEDGEDHGG